MNTTELSGLGTSIPRDGGDGGMGCVCGTFHSMVLCGPWVLAEVSFGPVLVHILLTDSVTSKSLLKSLRMTREEKARLIRTPVNKAQLGLSAGFSCPYHPSSTVLSVVHEACDQQLYEARLCITPLYRQTLRLTEATWWFVQGHMASELPKYE